MLNATWKQATDTIQESALQTVEQYAGGAYCIEDGEISPPDVRAHPLRLVPPHCSLVVVNQLLDPAQPHVMSPTMLAGLHTAVKH